MKQLRNLFGSMLAVLAVAMMMTACNDVADNPTVPAKLTVTETNGIKVTKLILTSVGTNNVYDLTPYITDKDGMSSFSCDQIFIEANVNDFYYDVYAEDVMGNKYATNVYLNMVRGQQNTLEVTLKRTYAAQTLQDLTTALTTNPAKKGAVVTFLFADGSKITFKPALVENAPLYLDAIADEDDLGEEDYSEDEDASQEAYTWLAELKPELSGPMFDALKGLKIQEDKTLEEAVSFWKGYGYIRIRLELDNVFDESYYYPAPDETISEAEREARRKAYIALREASNFEVYYQVDEEKGDFYRVNSYNGLEVPQIIYKKDANSEEGEVKVLRDITEEYNKVSFKFIAPEADDEVWSEIVKRNPEEAKFLTETDFTYKYPTYEEYEYPWSDLRWDDWSFQKFTIFGEYYWVWVKNTEGHDVQIHNVIGYVISCKIGDQWLDRKFFLQKKNEEGKYVLVHPDNVIDPEGDYILDQWVEPVVEPADDDDDEEPELT